MTKTEKYNENAPRSVSVIIPPDGKYGWVIMCASFCCNLIVDGIVFNSGFIQNDIEKDFKLSKAQVGFVSSLLSGFYLLAGPFVSYFVNKIGFRFTTIIGSIIAASGFLSSYFVQNIYILYITYGIVGGIGFCLIYIPSVLTVGYYFEKWRALATGISLCGSGVGTFLFAPLTEYLVQSYGWRFTVCIDAGIILLCGGFAILFRPLKPTVVSECITDTKDSEFTSYKLNEKKNAYSVPTSAHTTWIKNQNYVYPKAIDIFPERHNPDSIELKELQPLAEHDDENNDGKQQLQPMKLVRRNTIAEKGENHVTSSARTSLHLRRDDSFLFGSLQRLPKYTSQSSIAYHVSVTHLGQRKTNQEPSIAEEVKLALFKSPSFLLLAVSGFFTMSGFFVPFLFVTLRAREKTAENFPGYLIPAIGISNTIGRILCGLLSSSTKINALHLNNIFIALGGIATMASGLYMEAYWQLSYSIIFGFAIACFSALRSIITVELMGLENLTNAFGILMMFQGAAAIIGGPLAGFFMDLTKDYDVSFYIAGGLMTFSALLCLPLKAINNWEKNKANNQKQ